MNVTTPEMLKALGTSPFESLLEACMDRDLDLAREATDRTMGDWSFIGHSYGPAVALLLRFVQAASGDETRDEVWHRAWTSLPDDLLFGLVPSDRRKGQASEVAAWDEIEVDEGIALAEAMLEACRAHFDEALSALEEGRRAGSVIRVVDALATYQVWHDSWLALTQAVMRGLSEALGEGAFGEALEAWGRVMLAGMLDHLPAGADSYDPIVLLNMQAAGMRAHLSGPDRSGSFLIREEDDRFVMEFDACGSGGRLRRDIPSGSASLLDGAGTTQQGHAWSAGMEGVPLYCNHCFWQATIGTELIGYPGRITDYNPDPNAPCQWLIYKDLESIPVQLISRHS